MNRNLRLFSTKISKITALRLSTHGDEQKFVENPQISPKSGLFINISRFVTNDQHPLEAPSPQQQHPLNIAGRWGSRVAAMRTTCKISLREVFMKV